jgi:two-component system, cell cycle sensor histidine kinase and response regulator CckA
MDIQKQLEQQRQARLAAEEQVRAITADCRDLKMELNRCRGQFESMVAQRTAELVAGNEKLIQENRARRLADRERRCIEDQFREASLMLEAMLDAIPDIIGVQDLSGRIIRMNQAGYRFFEKTEDQVIGNRCYELIGETVQCRSCVARQILTTNKPAQVQKFIPSKNIWMDIRAYPIRDMDGRVFRIVEHWRDITELKKSEASLIESEEKYRLLVDNANEGVFIFQSGAFKFSNRKAREIARKLGMAKLRKALDEYIYPDDRSPDDTGFFLRRLNGLEDKPQATPIRLTGSDGEPIWVEMNTININWKGSAGTLNFIKDITQSKTLERRLQESQRLESLGTLAGGIAHDFNNLLMGIQGNVSLMYLEVEPDAAIAEKLKNIEDCVDSGSRLTKQLLGFARGGKYVVKPMDMNKILHSSADMFGRARKAIRVHENYQPDLWTVMADGSQIEQVMVNLFLNAWQAMNGTGDMYLQTSNVFLDESFVKPFDVPAGGYVKISVTDTGIGMDEATQRRIFEPFFTTHEPGRGTGLGLASVFGIVKNHSGIITVKSRPGHGSTFDIYLPSSNKNPERDAATVQSIELGSETILLVDDEEYIIDVSQLMLEGLGYTLLVANNGQTAIDLFTEKKDMINLVVLDMVMPDMDGEEVLKRLRQIRPDIKVILSSGYYIAEQAQALIQQGFSDFLQKPFNMQQLSTKIRHMLATPLPGGDIKEAEELLRDQRNGSNP